MKRRDFLKSTLLASGLLGLGQMPASAKGNLESKQSRRGVHRRIDSYCHFSSMEIIEYLEQASGIYPHVFRSLFANTTTLINLDHRLNLMDECEIDMSVLVPLPWIETAPPVYNDPQKALQAAQILNDQLADIAVQYPDRFRAVALLPTTNPDVMLQEFERAVNELGMVGGFYVVGPTAKPPDHPDYEYLYQKAVELDVPLWMHPSRPPIYPDYVGEPVSKFQIWQTLSWLMDSSAAMVRLVMGGLFERLPDVKIIIHHHGALIPLFAERMQYGWEYFEQNTGVPQDTPIDHPYIEHFKKFYCDTATQGYAPLVMQVAYDFFGPDHVLFGSDATMDAENGRIFTMEARRSLEDLRHVSTPELRQMYHGNAERLLGIPPA